MCLLPVTRTRGSRYHSRVNFSSRRERDGWCSFVSSIHSTPRMVANMVTRDRLTMHNVHYMLSLMKQVRNAIIDDRYPEFLRNYFRRLYGGDSSKIPQWAVTALRNVGVDLRS